MGEVELETTKLSRPVEMSTDLILCCLKIFSNTNPETKPFINTIYGLKLSRFESDVIF